MQNFVIQKPKLKISHKQKQEIYSENSDAHPERQKTGQRNCSRLKEKHGD